jgi:hydroxymethylbilane synthase
MPENALPKLRIGTRGSQLALWQAHWVAERLREDGCDVELIEVTTAGDTFTGDLLEAGTEGLFTKELQRALLDGQLDLAVHSLKDLPTQEPPGLVIAAIPMRGSAQDVLVANIGQTLAKLPPGSRIGTGSARRKAQILHARGDVKVVGIRGNVDTRLQKLDQRQYDALVLAEAGLERLECAHRITERLTADVCLPAAGQGALAIEVHTENETALQIVSGINDPRCEATTTAERSFLSAIEAGCSSPAAAWCRFESDDRLRLDVAVYSIDGQRKVSATIDGAIMEASELGKRAAEKALASGAADLLR